MTLAEAAAAPGRKAVVSGEEVRDGKRVLMIYSVASDGFRELAWSWVPVGEIEARLADWKAQGVEDALTDPDCGFIWICGADSVEVFDSKCKVLDAVGDRATRADGAVIARGDVVRVFAWATDDYVHRGVKATLQSGEDAELVTEISMGALAGAEGWPVYSRNEYLCDTGWCLTLGDAIARWAGAAFESRLL
jgi:hypothetical protein